MRPLLLAFCLFVFVAPPGFARGHGRGHAGTRSHSSSSRSHKSNIHRSKAEKDKFMRQSGYPHGRKGYVVDHIIPLANGGKDDPSNMQWQTVADAKAKDKVERKVW
jgi:hypothetical protein